MNLRYLLTSAALFAGIIILANCSPDKTPGPMPVGPASDMTGQELYEHTACIFCHGKTGMADAEASANLKPPATNFTDKANYRHGSSKDEIFKTISHGVHGTAMASYGYLHETDRMKLAEYIISFQKQ